MIVKYGIDFGTTNSSIAVRFIKENEEEETIVVDLKDKYPKETLPSVICIVENGDIAVGLDAYVKFKQAKSGGKEARVIKRIKIDLEKDGAKLEYLVGDRVFGVVELIAAILRYLRYRAEAQLKALGLKPSGVVVGVPVQYGDPQKNILKQSLFEAGYYTTMADTEASTEFVSEPVAVAVHYGLQTTDNKTVLVFDFGGGTLDLAIVNLSSQVGIDHLHPHEVIAKDRITLGGEELTKQFFLNVFCGKDGYGTSEICKAFRFDKRLTAVELWNRLQQNDIGLELIDEIEQCKCELSTVKISEFAFVGPNGVELEKKLIYRPAFEEAISEDLQRIDDVVNACLEKGQIDDPFMIDHVLIAGGSSLIPCVQEILIDKFGKKKVATRPGNQTKGGGNFNKKFTESEVLTSIVRGLAAIGCRRETLIEDVVDNDYGLWLPHDKGNEFCPIIENGTPVRDAAIFDKALQEGKSEEIECFDKRTRSINIHVYQRNKVKGPEELGTIHISDAGGKIYRVFMHIDQKQGMLLVDVFDIKKNHWFAIPLNQNEFDISDNVK